MKKKMLAASAALLITVMIIALAGCGNASSGTAGSTQTGTAQTSDPAPSGNTSDTQTVVAEGSDLFTTRDLTQNPDLSGAQYITVTDGQTVNITEEGIYVLSGSARDAVIAVDAGDDDKVQLVLDGLYIENAHQCCILVENADKVFITSVEDSVNTLAVSGKFTSDEDAVIFSRDDLVLNGLGAVEISSTGDGIRSNDEIKITGGTWNVTASDGAIKAHEGIYACAGTCSLTAGGDGLHAENNDDDTAGSVVIEGGSFTIRAGDDGIHATTQAVIEGGSITISAAEGIEATQVIINGGELGISASDDGINAGKKSNSMGVRIEINGGDITIVMGAGDTDGVDSNGDLIITGGRIDVTAQSPFDYDGSCTYTGGTIIVNGEETNSVTNQMMGPGGGGPGGGPGANPGGRP